MNSKKSLGEKLSILAKSLEKSQAKISENTGLAPSQLNRFFKGHREVTSDNLLLVLSELGIDLEEIISRKTRKFAEIDETKIETKMDCLKFLFKNIDELGQQTYLKQLAWANTRFSKKQLPQEVQDILKKEMHLI